MVLAGLGADVVRVERPPGELPQPWVPPTRCGLRGQRLVTVDLKSPAGRDDVLALAAAADVLIEPFRPGAAERLGIGPQECCGRSPRPVYARMTGFGQQGPLAIVAGHDLNYAAVAGAAREGPADRPPPPPLNLVADYGGGSMLLVVGVLAALWERERSGEGQVLDVAMLDGVALLLQQFWAFRGLGLWAICCPRKQPARTAPPRSMPTADTCAAQPPLVRRGAGRQPQFDAALLEGVRVRRPAYRSVSADLAAPVRRHRRQVARAGRGGLRHPAAGRLVGALRRD